MGARAYRRCVSQHMICVFLVSYPETKRALRDRQHPLPFFPVYPNSFFNFSCFAITYVMICPIFPICPVSGQQILEKQNLKAGFSGDENRKNMKNRKKHYVRNGKIGKIEKEMRKNRKKRGRGCCPSPKVLSNSWPHGGGTG